MTISSEIKEQLRVNSGYDKLEFQNFSEIYFPHICIICRNQADKHIAKNFYSLYQSNKEYKKNYTFSLPVCDSCRNNMEMKTGLSSKSGKLLLMSIILGLIIASLLFLTLNSIFLSISIFALFTVLTARNYKIKTKSKIKFENHLKIQINPKNPDIVELEFSDKEYAKTLEEINLSQLKLKREREAKEKQEREAKEKPQQIPDNTETQQIDENIEIEKTPVEITITEPVSEENNNTEQRTTCPKCKMEIKSEWVFCDNCGNPLKK